MKNLQLVFAIVFGLFLLQSCEKENLELAKEDVAPALDETMKNNSPQEESPEPLLSIKQFPKEMSQETIQVEPEMSKDETKAQSRGGEVSLFFVPDDPSKLELSCDMTTFGSTIGAANTISNSTYRALGFNTNLNGGDQLYAIQMNRTDVVRFDLTNTRQNLAMVLYEGDYDFNRRELILRRIVSWTTSSSNYGDYIGPVTLTPGNYILVVDSKPGRSSDYRLSMTCDGASAQTCDDLENYYTGDISPQSAKWEKWSYSDKDGQVTRNAYGEQMLKVETATYGNHPDLLYRTGRKTRGKHRLSMNMWIYNYRSGYLGIQKRLRNEWGGQIHFYSNGRGEVKINGKRLSFSYPQSQWMMVELEFDFYNNRTKLYIDGRYKAGWGIREHSGGSYGSYQLEGLNFYPASSSDQVYVDNVCFEEI